MTTAPENTTRARALMPDYLRLFALFGIVVVNVQFIAFSVFDGGLSGVPQSRLDAITLWVVNGVATFKSYGLFSFMFGVGLGFLMQSAQRRGLAFGRVYRNRMIGLFLIGIAHGCLFFPGDILVIYAVTGAIMYRWRAWEQVRLVKVGAVLIALASVLLALLMFLDDATPKEFVAFEQTALGAGGLIDAVVFRTIGFALTLPFLLLSQGVAALGWFCLGLAAIKAGMIDDADHRLWQRARRVCLLPGLTLSLVGSGIAVSGTSLWGGALVALIAPFATLGYLGLIAVIARPPGPMMARILAAGGASLSIYLGQSIILSTIFSGYGLGLWESVDRLTATLIAVIVTVVLIAAVSVWRTWFRLGPFEMLLRRITYA